MTESMTSYNAANDACDSNELFEVAFSLFFHEKQFVLKKIFKKKSVNFDKIIFKTHMHNATHRNNISLFLTKATIVLLMITPGILVLQKQLRLNAIKIPM